MIPILYDAELQNLETTSNGICRLVDSTSCVVTEERNGEYVLTLTMPFQGRHADELLVDRIIKVVPNDTSQPQCFRIVKVKKNMQDMSLEVLANHISYDMSFIPVRPFSATATGRQQAFSLLWENTLEDNPFTYDAPDDTLTKQMGSTEPKSLRSLLGGVSGSILDLFGGEFEFDNRRVIWHLNRGTDNGVTIRHGKNLTNYEQEENIANTVCGVIPFYSREGTVIYGDIQYCSNVDNYAVRRTVPYDFTLSFPEEAPTKAQLNEKARAYVDGDALGVPDVSIHVEFRQLWDSPEYEHIRNLEHVSLCDTVSVYFPQLAVLAKAKVVKTEYNCLLERYNFVELGSVRRTISDRIADVNDRLSRTVTDQEMRIYQNEVNTVLADKVSTNVLTAYQASVTNLLASKAEIADLNAHKAAVLELIADRASIDDLQAVEAVIESLDATYAQIDFANVDTATISAGFAEQLLVSQGLVADAVTAESAQITGYLTGVGIVANSIQAGTLDAGNITVTNLDCASLTVGKINGQQIANGTISLSNLNSEANTAISTALEDAGIAVSTAERCIVAVSVEYAQSQSDAIPPASGWSPNAPSYRDGYYTWQRTATTLANGTVDYSDTLCITGIKGEDGEDATVLRIDSSRGTLFKNAIFSTVLTVVIAKGPLQISGITALREEYGAAAHLSWKWKRMNDDEFSTISASDSRLSNDGFTFTITPSDVDEKIVFQCDLEI